MQIPLTRRQALVAAGAATAIGIGPAIADEDSQKTKPGGDGSRDARTLKLKVVLTDGQIVSLNATELIIDFGDSGKLLVKPGGFAPVEDRGPKDSPDGVDEGDNSQKHSDGADDDRSNGVKRNPD